MQLVIAAVGHKMPAWIAAGFNEYAQRMPADCRLLLKEIKPVDRALNKNPLSAMRVERERIEAALAKNTLVIALDERGQNVDSQQLAQRLTQWQQTGREISFVIGGADGLDDQFKQRADGLLRISSLTLPHGLVRVLLAEQLYRAWSINQHHPYHRPRIDSAIP